MKTSESVAVVVCTYTRARLGLLRAALASLRAQEGVKPEVVVVVDGAPELEAELRADPDLAFANVVANSGPRGLSSARNSGIDASSADLIAFLDDDAVAEPDWLRLQVAAFEDPKVMVTGGTVLPALAAERPAWWPEEFDWTIGCSYPGQLPGYGTPQGAADAVPVRNVIGASMVFRRSAISAVGPFSTGLGRVDAIPLGGEETEICIRVGQAFGAGAVVLVPRSVVHHHVPQGRLTARYLLSRCYAEGLSKAVLSRLVRSSAGLSSEAAYLTRTLPVAAARHLRAVLSGDVWGLARVGALGVATAATGLGWLRGRFAPAAPEGGS